MRHFGEKQTDLTQVNYIIHVNNQTKSCTNSVTNSQKMYKHTQNTVSKAYTQTKGQGMLLHY